MKFTRFLMMGAVILALCFPQGGWATDWHRKRPTLRPSPGWPWWTGGKYPESWDAAAEIFKKGMPTESWQKTLKANRRHLGKVVSRKLKSATYTKKPCPTLRKANMWSSSTTPPLRTGQTP